ncbi:DNA-binding response regulator, LuxR family [Actinomycetales bacterium JB111]|nr:DNA-binding response regulator, LuxR family [Actinomycetales bacterium JB111]
MSETEQTDPIRVVLVDDQQLVRAGFGLVIGSQPDMVVAGEAGDGAQALRALGTIEADVVLMDIRMPNLDGLAATRALTERAVAGQPAPKVVILTTFDLDEYVLEAIRAGASGFLLKDAPPEDMLAAIRTVHRGDAVIAPSTTRRLIETVATLLPPEDLTSPDVLDALTDREREVLMLMARGRTNTEIGAELFVAEATVKTHVGRVLAKLGARDRVQAVVLAYETGLVQPGR